MNLNLWCRAAYSHTHVFFIENICLFSHIIEYICTFRLPKPMTFERTGSGPFVSSANPNPVTITFRATFSKFFTRGLVKKVSCLGQSLVLYICFL